MTDDQWFACSTVLETFYPHNFKRSNETMMELWYQMLEDIPGDRVIAAVKHMVKTQPAFPSVADIRRLANPPDIEVGSAWSTACKWVSDIARGPSWRNGEEQPLPTLDPAIAAAVASVGREAIRMREPESEGVVRAHFSKAYEAELARARRADDGLLPYPLVVLGPLTVAHSPIHMGDTIVPPAKPEA